MSWLDPLKCTYRKRARVARADGTPMPELRRRPVTVNGVKYASLADACRALRVSGSVLYKMLGEAWRYHKRRK